MNKINRNSIVTLYHRIGFSDGLVLEDTFDDEPLTLRLGSGELASGLELGILGLAEGDEQSLDIAPEVAFGYRDEDLVQRLARSDFDPDKPLQPGLIIEFSTPTGETLPGTIIDIDDDAVTVDFNHPLAGHTVRYTVRIVSVDNAADSEELIN
jgi:FKBP-type peptidyl-prolyl cis-trans isomerase SlpA